MHDFVIKNGLLVRKNNFKKLPYGAFKTRDVAFTYRMGAGFAGAVNTSHPATIRGFLKDPTNPPTFFGQAVAINPASNGVRSYIAGDSTTPTTVFGVIVRSYPFLGSTAPTNSYAGTGSTPPYGGSSLPDGAVDVLLSGFILVSVVGSPSNGSACYIWDAVSSSPHVQSGWEASTPSGNGFAVTSPASTQFASPADANGICELRFNI